MSAATATATRGLRFSRAQFLSFMPYLLVVALFLYGALTIDSYATKPSIYSLLILSSLLGLASVGQTFAAIVGGIDLSIPAVIGMGNVMVTQLYGEGWPFWEVCLTIAGFAVLVGVANSITSVVLRVHPLITSLGMGLIVGGAVLTWNNLSYTGKVPTWLPKSVSVIQDTGPIPLPGVIVVWAVIALAAIVFQRTTRIGREIYARGSNPVAAPLARVRSVWVLTVVFVISALCAALVGIFYAGYTGTANAAVGQPYFFETITAVVIGGTSLLGGRGGYGRTVAGCLIISQLTTILIGKGYGTSVQQALLGILVVALVFLYGRESHVSTTV